MPNHGYYCQVFGCRNNSSGNSSTTIHFHSFPSDEIVKQQWITFCKNPALKQGFNSRRVICSEHFLPSDYKQITTKQPRLNKGAIPTAGLPVTRSIAKRAPRTKRTGLFCSMIHCKNRQNRSAFHSNGKAIRFHRFPKASLSSKLWVTRCHNACLDKIAIKRFHRIVRVVCSLHFSDNMYTDPSRRFEPSCRLRKDAIPISTVQVSTIMRRMIERPQQENPSVDTLEDTNPAPGDVVQCVSTGMQCVNTRSGEINALRCKVQYYKRRLAAVQAAGSSQRNASVFTECHRNVPSFVLSQYSHCSKKLRGSRWNAREVQQALGIYYHSPKCYNHLRWNLHLSLPSVPVLKRNLSNTFQTAGICQNTLAVLQRKVQCYHLDDAVAFLVIDAMSIREFLSYSVKYDQIIGLSHFLSQSSFSAGSVATQILVVMLRGVYSNWKQPVAYYFIGRTVGQEVFHKVLHDVLVAVSNTGIQIVGIISDQETTQWPVVKRLCLVNETHMLHPVSGEKVYFLVDPPHLLKNTRNALRKYHITFSMESTAKWEHLRGTFLNEKQRQLKLLPKIKDVHFLLPAGSKMKVSYAAQIFSRSMSAAIHILVTFDQLCPAALQTAEFVEHINRLFDLVNTQSSNSCSKPVITKDTVEAVLLELEYFLSWIERWTFKAPDTGIQVRDLPFKDGWLMTIRSISSLLKDLFIPSTSKTYICTRRFTQDCIENLFGVLRGKNGYNFRPTSQSALAALKIVSCNSLIRPITRGANCEFDNDTGAVLLSDFRSQYIAQPTTSLTSNVEMDADLATDMDAAVDGGEDSEQQQHVSQTVWNIDRTEREVVTYIAGSVLRGVADSMCEVCSLYCKSTTPSAFIHLKKYNEKCNLVTPAEHVTNIFLHWESIFRGSIQNIATRPELKRSLIALCTSSSTFGQYISQSGCSTRCIYKMLDKYILLRLHHFCKEESKLLHVSTQKF